MFGSPVKIPDDILVSTASLAEPEDEVARIRVLLVQHFTLFREAMVRLLELSGCEVIRAEGTIARAIAPINSGGLPQLLVCDISPGAQAEGLLAEIGEARGRVAGMRAVVLADDPDERLLSQAAQHKIDAVLSKNISSQILRRSLDLVMLGQRLYPAPAFRTPSSRLEPTALDAAVPVEGVQTGSLSGPTTPVLSDREDQILRFLASGARDKLIAYDLGISEATVKFHIRALLRKVGARNRTQAAIWAVLRSS